MDGQLRILATTDLHMHLLGYDYFLGQPDTALGLAGLSDVIAARRADSRGACLLVDNGDFLQGTPLADALAQERPHPLAESFASLRYDAVTLGNHEFDYGTAALAGFLAQLPCPAVSANLQSNHTRRAWQPFVILTRDLQGDDGRTRSLRIGITGFAPPSLSKDQGLRATPFSRAASAVVPQMRAAGADLVIALCHAGLDQDGAASAETADILAQTSGIDVLVMGHTHDSFPDGAGPATATIDPIRGTVHGKPAVMAGCFGRSLGEIDLTLQHDAAGWRIIDHRVRLHPNTGAQEKSGPERRRIEDRIFPTHAAVLGQMHSIIGDLGQPLHNHFATIRPDPVAQLFAKVMRQAVTDALGSPCHIAAVAPSQPAGTKGQQRAIDLPVGPMVRQDAMRLFPFKDRLCAVRRTGRQLRLWLERSAALYSQLAADGGTPHLIAGDSSGYHCDALYGLRYDIDLGAAALFDLSGAPLGAGQGRIRDMRCAGQPVQDDDSFVIATTDFRAGGGGGFAQVPPQDILWTAQEGLRDTLARAIGQGQARDIPDDAVWRFLAPRGSKATLAAHPDAARFAPPDLAPLAQDHDGSLRYLMRF